MTEKYIICWKYKDKSGRGTRKYATRWEAEHTIKKLNPDITYWVEEEPNAEKLSRIFEDTPGRESE